MAIDFTPRQRLENNYRAALQRLMDAFIKSVPSLGAMSITDIMTALTDYCTSKAFQEYTLASASRMVTGLMVDTAQSWREAARESMQGRLIYNMLRDELQGPVGARMQEIVFANARLISSFPADIAPMVNTYVKEESLKGRRPEAIAEDLIDQFPDVAAGRISLIARTETSKAATALTRVRSEELGLSWYKWATSRDVRVRRSHRLMDGVLVNWNDPPSPEELAGENNYGKYGPGETFYCRCVSVPVLDLDAISWPVRVYHAGTIAYMTRSRFERIAGGMRIAA